MTDILQGGKKDHLGFDTSGLITNKFVITNITPDYAMDCNAASDLEICDVLGTLIRELIQRGIINGTVA
jgi:hypothetical protein